MGRIRMGFIGCGGNASGHIGRVLAIPETEVVALCDVSEESLQRARERHPACQDLPAFSDYERMLSSVELDAVEISTPHTLHFNQIMAALECGLHVLSEKPMVCKVDHARSVIAKAREVGKTLMVSYQRHLAPQFRHVQKQIQSGELGEVQFVSALQDQNWYQLSLGTWRQQMVLSGGGQLNDSGSHLLDIVLWMTGLEVAEVHAYMENFDSEVDINSALSVRFSNGVIGNISVVGNSPAAGIWEDITIWGSKAVVYLRNGHLTIRSGSQSVEPERLPPSTTVDQNFVDAILGRNDVQVPPECGLRVIELTEAAWESARIGVPVKVNSCNKDFQA